MTIDRTIPAVAGGFILIRTSLSVLPPQLALVYSFRWHSFAAICLYPMLPHGGHTEKAWLENGRGIPLTFFQHHLL